MIDNSSEIETTADIAKAPRTGQKVMFTAQSIEAGPKDTSSAAFERAIRRDSQNLIQIPFNHQLHPPQFSLNGRYVWGLASLKQAGILKNCMLIYDLEMGRVVLPEKVTEQVININGMNVAPSISQNGKYLLYYDLFDQVIVVTELKNSGVIQRLKTTGNQPITYAIDDEYGLIAVGGSDNRIRCWKIGEERHFAEFPQEVVSLSRIGNAPLGQFCIKSHYSDRVWMWDPNLKARDSLRLDMTDEVWSLDFSPDQTMLAACGDDNRVHIWSMPDWREQTFNDHQKLVTDGKFSHSGQMFASVDFNGILIVRDTRDWRIVLKAKISSQKLRSVTWTSDDSAVITGGDASELICFNLVDQAIRRVGVGGKIHDTAFSNAGTCLLVLHEGDPSKLIKLKYPELSVISFSRMEKRPLRMAINGAESLVAIGFQEGGFEVYDLRSLRLINAHDRSFLKGPSMAISFLNSTNNLLVSSGLDQNVQVLDTNLWEMLTTFADTKARIQSISVSNDGKRLALGDMAGVIQIFDLEFSK